MRALKAAFLVFLMLSAASEARAAAACDNPTIEIHCDHDDIVAKAEELGTPLAMFKFVRNTIEFEIYYGSKKGALGTLRSGRGNDYDQASLLIALLRAGGYEARYGLGVANVDDDQLTAWSGIRDSHFNRLFFQSMYCRSWKEGHPSDPPVGPCTENPPRFARVDVTGQGQALYFERAWVEVRLPEHYRGVEVDDSNLVWIPLDPAWKRKAYPPLPSPPIPAGVLPPLGDEVTGDCDGKICFDYEAYWSQVDPRLTSEIWERQIQEWLAVNDPDTALADILRDGPIIPYEGEVLPASLPFYPEPARPAEGNLPEFPPIAQTEDLGTLADGVERRFKIGLRINGNLLGELESPALADQRVTVSFPPTPSARSLVLSNGGYLGGWTGSGDYASVFEYCVLTSTASDCSTEVVLRLEGVEQQRLSLGMLVGDSATLRLDVDATPGVPRTFNRSIVTGETVALAVDLGAAGSTSIRDRLGRFVRHGGSVALVDEGAGDDNHNGIPGEVLIDQGGEGITECPDYGAASAMTECDVAVGTQFEAADGLIGELLHLAALRYYQRVREESRRINLLDRLVVGDFPAAGITKSGVHFTYLFDQPVGVEPSTPIIDIPGFFSTISTIDSASGADLQAFALRTGRRDSHTRSALEHQVWEELIGGEFVSTVKGIQLVRERFPERPVVVADANSWSSDLSSLQDFPFDTIADTTLAAMAPVSTGITITPTAAVATDPTRLEVYFTEGPQPGGGFAFSATIVHNGQMAGGAIGNPFGFYDPLSWSQDLWGFSAYDYSFTLPMQQESQGFGDWGLDLDFNPFDSTFLTHNLAGDPVSMISGNLNHTETDLRVPGDGPAFELVRTYNSRVEEVGALGYGWSHSYEAKVEPVRAENSFVYLPSSLTNFDDQNRIEGARSDTLETSNAGTGSTERLNWDSMPAAFLGQAEVDSVDLELAFEGVFDILAQAPSTLADPGEVTAAGGVQRETIRLLTTAGDEFTDLSQPIELRLQSFGSGDELRFARLRIRYRGPAVERESLVPVTLAGWTDASSLSDEDPSTCTQPTTNDRATIDYTPVTLPGAFGWELLVSVVRESGSGSPEAALWRGSVSSGERFILGPNGQEGRQLRFTSVDPSAQGYSVEYDATHVSGGSREVELCHLDYRVLVMPPRQMDVVLGDGSRLRFTEEPDGMGGTVWEPDPGVREVLSEDANGFALTRTDGSTLRFDRPVGDAHLLTEIADAQGRKLLLAYDAQDRLQTVSEDNPVTFSDGTSETPTLTFRYAPNGYLDTVTDWTNRVWDYDVDNDHLIQARDPVEVVMIRTGTVYEYDLPADSENEDLVHNLTRVIFPKDVDQDFEGDHYVEFEYYHSDRVASHTDSLGNQQRFLFNIPRLESEVIDARGFRTIYRHDRAGNLVQRVDPDGAAWDWAYDEDRRIVSETDALGFVRHFEYTVAGSGGPCEPVDRGNPCQVIDRDGRTTHFLYDGPSGAPRQVTDKRGNVSSTTFANGLPTEQRATVSGTPNTLLQENVYDASSHRLDKTIRRLELTSPRQAVTRLFYLPGDRDVERIEHWEDANGDGEVAGPQDRLLSAKDIDYDRLGRPLEERITRIDDPDGITQVVLVTAYQYSLRGEVERITRPDGTALVAGYDDNGNLEFRYLEEILPKPGPGGPTVQHERLDLGYDAIDRLIQVTDALGHITGFEHDGVGNRIATTDPLGNVTRTEYDPVGRPLRTIDANGSVSTVGYDLAGRVVREVDPTGVETANGYDEVGRLISVSVAGGVAATLTPVYGPGTEYREELRDPNQGLTVFELDELGRPFKVTDADLEVTLVDHDLRSNVIRFEDASGAVSTFTFDALGRQIEAHYAWTAAPRVQSFDETGNPVRITKPDGCRIDMGYDRMGRIKTRSSDDDTCDGSVRDQFGYDARGNLVAAANDHVGLLREYDELGRLIRETDDRLGNSVGYVYDPASRLTGKVYPDGSVVHVSYDPAGRPIGITDPFGDTTRYIYDPAGRRIETRSSASGLSTQLGYDARGRLASISGTRANGADATFHDYPLYDEAGNRLQMQSAGGTTGYTYDALHRLASENPPGGGNDTTHYQYDAAGNRTRSGLKQGSSWVPPYKDFNYATTGPNHRLTSVTDNGGAELEAFPSYDANGNPTAWATPGDSRTLTWDALGQLVAIAGASFSGTYVYDPLGRRIAKTELGTTTLYQYDGIDVVAEYDATFVHRATYVFGPGIDEPLRIERDGTRGAFHADGLGSISLVSNVATSADLASYQYDAFGVDVNPGGGGSFDNAYTFTGRERDASGLYYYRARYYLASTGRFLTPDPVGLSGGINPYAYVGSNPVNFRDPFGLTPIGAKTSFGNAINPVQFSAFSPPSTSFSSQGVNPLVQPFGFDPVPGGGSFRGEFFIMTPEPLGVLAGDARGFDIGPNPARSRAFFDINFAAGTGAFQINPTCSAGGGGCVAPLPIGQGNSLDISVTGSTVNIVGNLTQAKTPAPLLTPSITFDFQVSPTGFSGSRNAGFPSFEATRTVGGQTRFIVRSPESSSFFAPLCLTGICGNEQF